MAALRIGIIALNNTTLAEITPMRKRFKAQHATVTLMIPGGGSILPVTGRYYPAAGGHGLRCALGQVAPADFDLLVLPDSITADDLARCPQVMDFLHGAEQASDPPPPLMPAQNLVRVLDRRCDLGVAHSREDILSGATRVR